MPIEPDELEAIGKAVREIEAARIQSMKDAAVRRQAIARKDGLAMAERILRDLPRQLSNMSPTGRVLEVLSAYDLTTQIAARYLLEWAEEARFDLHYGNRENRPHVFYVEPGVSPYENTGYTIESWPEVA